VSVVDETLDTRSAGVLDLLGAMAGSSTALPAKMESRATDEVGVQCRAAFPVGDMAGTGERMDHVTGNNHGVEGLSILVGYMAGTTVGISPKHSYGSPEPNAFLSADASFTSFKASV